jgi:hypothetical protein
MHSYDNSEYQAVTNVFWHLEVDCCAQDCTKFCSLTARDHQSCRSQIWIIQENTS